MSADRPRIPEPSEFFQSEPQDPLYPFPTRAQVEGVVRAEGADGLRKLLQFRRDAIVRGREDPLQAGRPKFWRIADRLKNLEATRLLVLFGGNRSTKSWYCADAMMRSVLRALEYNRTHGHTGITSFLIGSDSEANSKLITQPLFWHFLPQRFKALNHRRTKFEKASDIDVNYSNGDGFADRVVSLGHGVVVSFVLYTNDPSNFEGGEFGPKNYRDVAWWMDESLPLNWLQMLRRRGRFRPGIGLWSFTPIRGITESIKEVSGGKVRRTRKAKLLPSDQVLIPGLRAGRVPFVQDGVDEATKIVYFHSDLTPFGSGGQLYSATVAEDCRDRPTEYTLRIYYGYTKDVIGKAFPKYSRQVHWIPVDRLPWEGTNYCFIDPADRNWFIVWVRVAPGSPRRFFLYRDWPDKRRYDSWAVPSTKKMNAESRRGMDGDAGPAQASQGWGVPRYKRLMLSEETISLTLDAKGLIAERDPYRRHLANLALIEGGLEPVARWQGYGGMPECQWAPGPVDSFRAANPAAVREAIRIRKIDPRAAANPQQGEQGRITLLDLFGREDLRPGTDIVEAGRMTVLTAYSGRGIDDGVNHVNELLDYDERQPLCPILNEPRFYVADNCEQVDWMFQHYTGEGGEDGACKDPADLVRYIAQDEDVRHLASGGKLKTGGFSGGF